MAAKEKEKTPLAQQLRELLSQATAEDVKEIDAAIETKQAEIDALKADRKMLAQAAGLEQPKSGRGVYPRKKKAGTGANTPPAPTTNPRSSVARRRSRTRGWRQRATVRQASIRDTPRTSRPSARRSFCGCGPTGRSTSTR